MVAQLAKAASAELIDFEQARIKRSISSKQGELSAFAARIACLLEEGDTHVGDMLANAPIAINPAPRPAGENRSLEADRGMREPMARFLFQDFKRELSLFEARLEEIDLRINALHQREPQPPASAPQSRLAVLPLMENPLAQAGAATRLPPLSSRAGHAAASPAPDGKRRGCDWRSQGFASNDRGARRRGAARLVDTQAATGARAPVAQYKVPCEPRARQDPGGVARDKRAGQGDVARCRFAGKAQKPAPFCCPRYKGDIDARIGGRRGDGGDWRLSCADRLDAGEAGTGVVSCRSGPRLARPGRSRRGDQDAAAARSS